MDLVTNLPKAKSKSSSLKSKSKSFLFKSESKYKSSKNGLKSGLESKSGLEYYQSATHIFLRCTADSRNPKSGSLPDPESVVWITLRIQSLRPRPAGCLPRKFRADLFTTFGLAVLGQNISFLLTKIAIEILTVQTATD